MELSYEGLRNAIYLRNKQSASGIIATIEFFPEEGKYHYDGHRKCGVYLTPTDAIAAWSGEMVCPVCNKTLTRGVMGRVMELADRPLGETNTKASMLANQRPFYSLIPLKEILSELLGTGTASKKVNLVYCDLIGKTGNELNLLMNMSISNIEKLELNGISSELLAQAIDRMRTRQVSITPGYDGEYGKIRVF